MQEDNKSKPENGVSKKLFFNKKIGLVIILTFVALITLSAVIYFFIKSDSSEQNDEQTVGVCSSRNEGSVLSRAKTIFINEENVVNKDELSKLNQEIVNAKNYESDANCLYPVMYSHILDQNYEAADGMYDMFVAAYGDGSKFARDIFPLQSPEDLKNLIDFSLNLQRDNNIMPTPNNVGFSGDGVNEEQLKEENQ